MNEPWPFWARANDMELANNNRSKAQHSGFAPEEEMQRNGRNLALRAGVSGMEFASTM